MSKIKCLVINTTFSKQSTYLSNFVPSTGNFLPINYMNEEITKVMMVTELVEETLKLTDFTPFDFVVYTK